MSATPPRGHIRLPELLAALAGLAAGLASLVGFIPGLYRDPRTVIAQSHGYDVGNLIAVVVLWMALSRSAYGSMRGRLIAIGALGCLVYSYVTYAFLIVLNPATVLYIAVLGLGMWSFVTGLGRLDDAAVEELAHHRLPRRTAAWFLVVVAVIFGITWLSQLGASAVSGRLPGDLASIGWPTNPIYVEDLGFILPLALVGAGALLKRRPVGYRIALSFLVFVPLLAVTILSMAVSATLAGQALQVPTVAIFIASGSIGTTLAWLGLRPARCPAASARTSQLAVRGGRSG